MNSTSVIALIDPIQRRPDNVKGCFSLHECGGEFTFCWFSYSKGCANPHLERVRNSRASEVIENIESIEFFDKPLMMIVKTSNTTLTYIFSRSQLYMVSDFIEMLLYRGIAVIADTDIFRVFLYKKSPLDSYFRHRPRKHWDIDCESLNTIWKTMKHEYTKYVIELENFSLLSSNSYPLDIASRVCHAMVMDELESFISDVESKQYTMIESNEWSDMFDSEGRLENPDLVRQRFYYSGVDYNIMPDALPFIVGLYPFSSSKEERDVIDSNCTRKFNALREEYEVIKDEYDQETVKVILCDIDRTDRVHPLFKDRNGVALSMIELMLRIYMIENRELGYLQGMNDLMVPILLVYIRNWDETGFPLYADGTRMDDWEKLLPKIYWLFDSLLRNTGQYELLASIQTHSLSQTRDAFKLFYDISPIAGIWMKHVGIDEFQWIYADYILMFKRSVTNVWDVWCQLNCAPKPKSWLSYFLVAVLLDSFEELVMIPDMCLVKIMTQVTGILEGMEKKMKRIAAISLWIAEKINGVT